MESILRKLNLGHLLERFEAERIEPELVSSMSDGNLANLGVSTIGDRVRLRELCIKTTLENNEDKIDDRPTLSANYRERVREEQNLLFQPSSSSLGSNRSGRGRKCKNAAPQRTWTVHFVCLADKYSIKTPNSAEKQILHKAGLGLK